MENNLQKISDFMLGNSNRASSPDQNTRQLRVSLDKPGRRNSAPSWYSVTPQDELVQYDSGRRLSWPGAEMDKIQEHSLPGHKQSNQDESAATQELGKEVVNKSAAFAKQMTDQPRPAIQSGAAREEDSISSVRTTLLPGSLNTKGLQGGGDVETRLPRQEQAINTDGVYIPPGNDNEEHYRLATFIKYPDKAKANCTDIAAAGFYYTGIRDKVTCFRCGISVENWTPGVDGMDKKWHKSDCRLMTGEDTDNKPIPTPNYRTVLRAHNGLPNSYPWDVAAEQIHSKKSTPDAESLPNIVISTKESSPVHGISNIPLHEDMLNESNYSVVYYVFVLVFKLVSNPEHESLLQSLDLKMEEDRRKTFSNWPANQASESLSDFAKNGFFYMGNHNHIRCFCCSGFLQNWPSTDGAFEQERLHLPECKMSQELDSGNIPLTDDERRNADTTGLAGTIENGDLESENISMTNFQEQFEPPDPSIEEQQQLAVQFPCSRPTNPHMESLEARIASFDSRWPGLVLASKEHLARAGFFFLGQSDKAKCFYCNGGLQNWDPDDEPWTEHAKWFSGCEYMIRQKGVDFVRNLKEAHPNLSRPYIRNSVSYDIPPNINQITSMGFSRGQIDNAIQRKRGGYNTTEELINDLLEGNVEAPSSIVEGIVQAQSIATNAGTKRGVGTEGATTDIKKTRTSSPAESFSTEGSEIMAESLRAMEEESLCKICKINKAGIVFTPCGHLCVCEACSERTKRCPICKAKVNSIVKVFRA